MLTRLSSFLPLQGESVLDKIREIEERSRAMKDQLTHKVCETLPIK